MLISLIDLVLDLAAAFEGHNLPLGQYHLFPSIRIPALPWGLVIHLKPSKACDIIKSSPDDSADFMVSNSASTVFFASDGERLGWSAISSMMVDLVKAILWGGSFAIGIHAVMALISECNPGFNR